MYATGAHTPRPFPRKRESQHFKFERGDFPGSPLARGRRRETASARPRRKSNARHVASDLHEVGVARGRLVDEPAVEHDQDAVGQLEELVQVFADQQHRRPAVARRDDLGGCRPPPRSRAEARVGRDQHLDLAAQLAAPAPRAGRCRRRGCGSASSGVRRLDRGSARSGPPPCARIARRRCSEPAAERRTAGGRKCGTPGSRPTLMRPTQAFCSGTSGRQWKLWRRISARVAR